MTSIDSGVVSNKSGPFPDDGPPSSGADVAVPQIDAPSDQGAVGLEARLEVVQEGLDRTDVENTQPAPLFGQHPRQQRKHCGLGLAAGGGRQQQDVVAIQHRTDGVLLKRPERPPPERVDDVMLKGWMQTLERGFVTHGSQLDVVRSGRGTGIALDIGQLTVGQGECIVASRIEVRVQIDPIEHILDQFLEEDARGDAHSAAQAAGDGAGETVQVRIVRTFQNALRGGGAVGVEVTDSLPDALQAVEVEVLQSHLRRPWIVEPVRAGEVDGEPLGERGQALYPLRTFEKRGGPGDHQIQARETAGIDLVEHLPEGVQALLPHIATDPLERLHLIEHHDQPREARVAQNDEQALEKS